jgi:uncharacterized protein with beta-barrel porin domain
MPWRVAAIYKNCQTTHWPITGPLHLTVDVSMDRNAAVVGARASLALNREARLNFDYNGLLGARDKTHGVGLSLDWQF